MASFLAHWHPVVGAGTPEGTEKGPKEAATAGLRGREGELEDFVFKEGESCGCVKMALRKIQ